MITEKLNKWTEELKKINGDNLVSVVSYDENRLLILLNEINFYNLLENSPLSGKIQKGGVIPLYLTEEYIKSSCDVFPLEYLKIKKSREVIYGRDILEGLEISAGNIRLESEQKIKGSLIRLTQVILEQGYKKKNLAKTSFLALEDLLTGMQGMLELAGVSGTADSLSLIDGVRQRFGIDLQPLKEVAAWKNGTKPEDIKKLIYGFYEKIEELAVLVDGMDTDKE